MENSFEEFLNSKDTKRYHTEKGRFVSVEDLGEWAWQEWKKYSKTFYFDWIFSKNKETKNLGNSLFKRNNLLWQIAIACLGKKEIEKRLKELSE